LTLVQYTSPTVEPVTLAEAKLALRLDSGSFAGNIETVQSIYSGNHGIHELMTLDVAPGGDGWSVGDTITGGTSSRTCVIVQVLTTKTYYVKDRSGTFTLGEVLSNGTATADQGATYPTFATGYYLIGAGVDILGYEAVVNLVSGTNGATGTNDTIIQESDDNSTYTDWPGGVFTQVTTANDNAVQEIAYSGAKSYIRTISKVLNAACEFGTQVIRNNPVSSLDDEIARHITAAREAVEQETSRAILTQAWDMFIEAWPTCNYIDVPFGNLQNTTGVEPIVSWKATDGTETTLTAGTDYLVETNGKQKGRIVLPYGYTWPTGARYPSNPIKIRFVCGWTSSALVPDQIKSAVLLKVQLLHQKGEGEVQLQGAIDVLLRNQRLY
jgi:uncharacterized phiE125 gp8 family phage protein